MARQRHRPAEAPKTRWLRPLVWVLVAAVVAGAAYAAVTSRARSQAAARLPGLPTLTGRPAALVQHISSADATARRSPRDPAVVGALGMAYHADLFYQEALTAYDVAADLDPANWRWGYYSALVHLERGDAAAASDGLRAVVEAQPDFGLAWWRLGESAFKQTKYDEAEMAYTRAASLRPSARDEAEFVALARVGQARIALNRGNAAAAVGILETVAEEWPGLGVVHRALADGYRALGRSVDGGRDIARSATLRAYVRTP